jgi:uncharacterized membrane protein
MWVYAPPGTTLIPVPAAQEEAVYRLIQSQSTNWSRPSSYQLPVDVKTPLAILVPLLVGLAGQITSNVVRIAIIVIACAVLLWLALATLGARRLRHTNRALAEPSEPFTLR